MTSLLRFWLNGLFLLCMTSLTPATAVTPETTDSQWWKALAANADERPGDWSERLTRELREYEPFVSPEQYAVLEAQARQVSSPPKRKAIFASQYPPIKTANVLGLYTA
ncbi:MAG: hypothetical protein IPM37_12120 [Hahellaceae bacterium]|nr:hypothetical protein [Hahellaceae bacterium]